MFKKKKLLRLSILLALIAGLSGCIPILLVAVGASAGGAIIYDKRSTGVMLQDREITNKALALINQDPVLKKVARVDVATFNHIVLLVGQAQTEDIKNRIYEDIRNIPQIRRVFNQVEIVAVLSFFDRSADAWITSEVKTVMLATQGLNSTQIKVVTENKVVYLMGIVTPRQEKLATAAAQKVKGVHKVVQVFEYEN